MPKQLYQVCISSYCFYIICAEIGTHRAVAGSGELAGRAWTRCCMLTLSLTLEPLLDPGSYVKKWRS